MPLPNFLGIGTQRAATTWLFECLKEHPNVFVPECKEVSFFNKHYDKGVRYYSSFFKGAEQYKAIGEISPDYLHNQPSPSRIYKELRDPKMIVILRNPIERAFSAYQFFIKYQTNWTFEETIQKRPFLLEIGLYYEHLMRFFSHFEKDCFLILIYEDLAHHNLSAIMSVYKFLEVDHSFRPSGIGKTNNTKILPPLQRFLENSRLGWTIARVRRTPAGSLIRYLHRKAKENSISDIKAETRDSLRKYFLEPNRKLEQLIGRDLCMWTWCATRFRPPHLIPQAFSKLKRFCDLIRCPTQDSWGR